MKTLNAITVLLMLLTASGWATALLRFELVAVDRLTRWISSLPHAMLTDIYCDLPTALILTALILVLTMLLYKRISPILHKGDDRRKARRGGAEPA